MSLIEEKILLQVKKAEYNANREYRIEPSRYDGFQNTFGTASITTSESTITTISIPSGYRSAVWRVKFFVDAGTATFKILENGSLVDIIKSASYDDKGDVTPLYILSGTVALVASGTTASLLTYRLWHQYFEA